MTPEAQIALRLRDQGGAALIIDYGYYPTQSADTLQALRHHKPVSIVECPGEADLTAHVNFHWIEVYAGGNGADVHGPVNQASFLIALGIALATYKFERQGFENQFVLTWSAVMLLLLLVVILGLIDVRLTWKLRRTLRERKRSSQ